MPKDKLLNFGKGGLLNRIMAKLAKKKKKDTKPGAVDDDALKRVKDRRKKQRKQLDKL